MKKKRKEKRIRMKNRKWCVTRFHIFPFYNNVIMNAGIVLPSLLLCTRRFDGKFMAEKRGGGGGQNCGRWINEGGGGQANCGQNVKRLHSSIQWMNEYTGPPADANRLSNSNGGYYFPMPYRRQCNRCINISRPRRQGDGQKPRIESSEAVTGPVYPFIALPRTCL